MISFDDMRVFVSVVENTGFSEAGRKLRMSTSKVSNRIARLEKELGTRLLNRTTRSVETTQSGQTFYEDSVFILSTVQQATARATETSEVPSGIVKVSLPVAFGQRILTPHIPRFMKRFPDITLQLEFTDRFSDILSERIDIAIRLGQMEDSNFKARILAPARPLIVATPEYLERHGVPKRPSDLEKHNCLLLRFPGSRQFKWSFKKTGKVITQAVAGTVDANNTNALLQMTLAHLGLSLQYDWAVRAHLEEGSLTEVLEGFSQKDAALHAIYPYEKFVPARIRVFIDFLQMIVNDDNCFK